MKSLSSQLKVDAIVNNKKINKRTKIQIPKSWAAAELSLSELDLFKFKTSDKANNTNKFCIFYEFSILIYRYEQIMFTMSK